MLGTVLVLGLDGTVLTHRVLMALLPQPQGLDGVAITTIGS